jgi:UDP-N-acetyl-D-glucosamine dehydrogenase
VLWEELLKYGAEVDFFDPYLSEVPPSREHAELTGIHGRTLEDISTGQYDAAIIATAHDSVDHDALAAMLPLVIDTRGVCKPAENVVKA